MSDASTGSERATGDASTPLEERAFGEAGSSFEAHARLRQSATARMRIEAGWGKFGVLDSVLNSPVPKPILNSPRIMPRIGQREAAGVTQHVGMH